MPEVVLLADGSKLVHETAYGYETWFAIRGDRRSLGYFTVRRDAERWVEEARG